MCNHQPRDRRHSEVPQRTGQSQGVAVSGLSSDVAERFCAARRAAGHTDRATVRALDPLLVYLRTPGVAPLASTLGPTGALEELLANVRRYLVHERGLVPAAARGYADQLRPFVASSWRARASSWRAR